mmetsp:Transcript_62145/g.140204  ORF Transcript_62145/g.140204 Transcript_62145/m.140204 type:complete len:246 (+) Transcript_62145:1-738(+)
MGACRMYVPPTCQAICTKRWSVIWDSDGVAEEAVLWDSDRVAMDAVFWDSDRVAVEQTATVCQLHRHLRSIRGVRVDRRRCLSGTASMLGHLASVLAPLLRRLALYLQFQLRNVFGFLASLVRQELCGRQVRQGTAHGAASREDICTQSEYLRQGSLLFPRPQEPQRQHLLHKGLRPPQNFQLLHLWGVRNVELARAYQLVLEGLKSGVEHLHAVAALVHGVLQIVGLLDGLLKALHGPAARGGA